MSVFSGTAEDPSGNGVSLPFYSGFSWACLFAIFFWFAAKKMWLWTFMSLLLGIFTSGISWFVIPFFANKLYSKHLLKKGYKMRYISKNTEALQQVSSSENAGNTVESSFSNTVGIHNTEVTESVRGIQVSNDKETTLSADRLRQKGDVHLSMNEEAPQVDAVTPAKNTSGDMLNYNNNEKGVVTKKIVRVTITNTGAEYMCGVVEDKTVISSLRLKIEEGSVSSYMEMDNGEDFSSSNYTNILQVYGPNISDAAIEVEETVDIDQDNTDREYKEIFSGDIGDTMINKFSSSNPNFYLIDMSDYPEECLIFYNQKIEKRIHYTVEVECNVDDFDLSDIYIGSMNMDETFSNDEIIEDVLYIPKDRAKQYMMEYHGNNYDADCQLLDYLSEIYSDSKELKEIIRENHLLIPIDIEGKGEWENDYIKITDLSGDVLFEEGEY